MMKRVLITLAVASALAVTGCSSVKLDDPSKVQTVQTEGDMNASALDRLAGSRSIYFAFDSYTVEPEYNAVVERNSRVLKAFPKKTVVIEGNTDSRGSREYNLALGQKRSEAVKKGLQILGVSPARMEAVSFGRERPVAFGENEEAWAKNRRADIVYH